MGLTTIGKCDSTGNSTGDHIHIELMINNNTVDPLSYIGIGGCDFKKIGSNC